MRKDDHCGNHISSKIQGLSALPCSAGSYMSATDSSKREGKPPRKKRGLMQTPAVLFSVCRLSGGGLSAGGDKLEAEHQQLRLIKHISVLPAGSWVGCISALFCIDTSISADLHKLA